MGGVPSSVYSKKYPPQGLERSSKPDKAIHNGQRKSSNARPSRRETGLLLNPEQVWNKNFNNDRRLTNRRMGFEGNAVNVERIEKIDEKVPVTSDSKNNASEYDELVDGWPKWLVDNISKEVLKNIVPKSADSYVKIDKVGEGTYSNVYKARDKETKQIVALKKVRFDTSAPESVKFMAREIMILQRLDHPNIVKLQGLATSRMQYSLYLVFDYMHCDLARILSQPDSRLTEPQIKCYMQQLLSGLQHCHERGILHRDIKGSNLLIDRNGMLKIADFGLANYFYPEKKRPMTSRVVTLWYRAPELLLGASEYGVGIDLWSAGCLLAEMFAGRPVLPGRSEVEQLHRIFKLCGTPSDSFYKRSKISMALKPPQTYRPTLRENFNYFPSSCNDLLAVLLALDPVKRGTAASALANEFFHTSPLACDLSGLPAMHVEEDAEEPLVNDKRRHRASKLRRRSQSQRLTRKKNADAEKPNDGSKEETQKSSETSVFTTEPESANTSNSLTTVNPLLVREVEANDEVFSRTEARQRAVDIIKKQHPLPCVKTRVVNYRTKRDDGSNSFDLVQRSVSSRDFRSLEKKKLLKKMQAVED